MHMRLKLEAPEIAVLQYSVSLREMRKPYTILWGNLSGTHRSVNKQTKYHITILDRS